MNAWDDSTLSWRERASALRSEFDTVRFDELNDVQLALVNERLDATGRRGLVWGRMTYACDRCHAEEPYEMEVGVEGPPDWRADGTYIATAFSAGRCPLCGGTMTHVRFRDDVEYEVERAPVERRVFRVPRTWPSYPTEGIADNGNVVVARSSSAFLSLNLAAALRDER